MIDPRTLAAQHEVERARARLGATVNELHDRLRPNTLMRDGVDRIRARGSELADDALDAARENPGMAGAVGAGAVLLVLRRPLGRLARRIFSRRKPGDEAAKK